MSKHSGRSSLQQGSAFEREADGRMGGVGGSEGETPDVSQLSRRNAVAYYSERTSHDHKGHALRATLIVLASVLVVGVVVAFAYLNSINEKLSSNVSSELLAALTDTSDSEPFYMLLLGTDKDAERAAGSYGEDYSGYRTDTIILARVDPQNKKVTLVSIPRDTYVDMGSNGKQKINAAYTFGGAAYAVQVVSEFAGVPISHVAEVDMDGFAAVVDAIGGVTVNLPVPVKDPNYTGLDLPAGEQTLDGHTAALLGRARHAYDEYGGGDFYREANQRMLIGAVAKKVLSSDPMTMASTISTMASYVTTDLDVQSIIALATKFVGMDIDSDIYSGQCPTISKYISGTWYEICDTENWRAIMQRVDDGLPPYESADQDATAGVAGSVGMSSADSGGEATGDPTTVTPVYEGNVLVLNASGKQGAAGGAANSLKGSGFDALADNASGSHAVTMVYYNGDSAAKAAGVADVLGVPVANIQANDGTWSTTQDVVVVLGTDWDTGQ